MAAWRNDTYRGNSGTPVSILLGIEADAAGIGIGIPASSTSVRYRHGVFRYRTGYGTDNFFIPVPG